MSSGYDEGPVYYREIQKNAYLKRIPNDISTSKLRPLGHKKPPLKPMWTLFCVHNGRTPFLEQYPEPDSPSTLAHRPAWRACLKTARHVTASVKPHAGDQYDFLVDTDHGPVRMLAPDWDSMQDWVSILRSKLHELRIVSRGENVYGAPPAAPLPRAAARDPTSPLPPTPPVPPDRVPGIDLTSITRPTLETNETPRENPTPVPTSNSTSDPTITVPVPQDIVPVTTTLSSPFPNTSSLTNVTSTPFPNTSTLTSVTSTLTSLNTSSLTTLTSALTFPSTSSLTNVTSFPKTSTLTTVTSTLPFPNTSSLTSVTSSIFPNTSSLTNVTSICSLTSQEADVDISNWEPFSLPSTSRDSEPKKGVAKICGQNICLDDSLFKRSATDSDEEFFSDRVDDDYEFKQRVVVKNGEHLDDESAPQRSNVTVIQVSNKGPPHTAIPVLGPETDVFDFEFKQSLTITPQETKQNFVNIVNTENDNSYGTVFENSNDYGHISLTTTVNLTGQDANPAVKMTPVNVAGPDTRAPAVKMTAVNGDSDVTVNNNEGLYERLCMASTSNVTPSSVRRLRTEKVRKSSLPNLDTESDYECLFPNSNGGGIRVESNRVRTNVERSQSQNAYDVAPRHRTVRRNDSPKRDIKSEKTEPQHKPIWKRGLTELSLLSRLRGIAQTKRQESPTRQEEDGPLTSPGKVVHRSRPAGRVDSSRRRSNSLTNCQPSPAPALQPLRARQAAALVTEQRRGACAAASVLVRDAPLLCSYEQRVWVARWNGAGGGARINGRSGDRIAALAGVQPVSAAHAKRLLKNVRSPRVDILFHRVPLAKIYVINKMEDESLGIKLDNECCIVSVDAQSPCGRAGLPPPGRWALTEVNNRPIDIVKGGDEEMNRLASHGTEVSLLIQPAALVKKMRAAIKANKPLLGLR